MPTAQHPVHYTYRARRRPGLSDEELAHGWQAHSALAVRHPMP